MNDTATLTVGGDWITPLAIAGAIIVIFLLVVLVRRAGPSGADSIAPHSTTAQLAAIETRLTAVERKAETSERMQQDMARTLAGLPTEKAVHEIEKQVIAVSGDVRAIAKETGATAAAVNRVEEFLMKASADVLFANRKPDGSA